MAGHRPAIVAEAGNPIAPENAFDPVVVQVTRPGQDQEVAIAIALTAEHCDFRATLSISPSCRDIPRFPGPIRAGPCWPGQSGKSIAKAVSGPASRFSTTAVSIWERVSLYRDRLRKLGGTRPFPATAVPGALYRLVRVIVTFEGLRALSAAGFPSAVV